MKKIIICILAFLPIFSFAETSFPKFKDLVNSIGVKNELKIDVSNAPETFKQLEGKDFLVLKNDLMLKEGIYTVYYKVINNEIANIVLHMGLPTINNYQDDVFYKKINNEIVNNGFEMIGLWEKTKDKLKIDNKFSTKRYKKDNLIVEVKYFYSIIIIEIYTADIKEKLKQSDLVMEERLKIKRKEILEDEAKRVKD